MKILLSFGAIVAFLGLAVASTFAQTQTSTSTSSNTTYIETSKLVGKPVKSSSGEEIGTIKDVVLDRNNGCMAYTVVSTSGGGGGGQVSGGGKMVAVPWSVYSPTSDVNAYTVTVDRQRIYSAPVFDYAHVEEYSRPDYINNVYGYYGVTAGAAIGTAVSSTSGESRTTNVNTNTGTARGENTRAGAAAGANAARSPAQEAAAGRSPAQETSPAGRGTPAPRATAGRGAGRTHATPSSRKRDTESSPTERTRGTREGREESSTPPSGRNETGSRSETERPANERERSETERPANERERSGSEGANREERTSGSQHHEKGKRETTSPSEKPPPGGE